MRNAALVFLAGSAAVLSGCVVAPTSPDYRYAPAAEPVWVDAHPAPRYEVVPPSPYYPAPRYEVVPPSPYVGGIWINGTWSDDRGRRYWTPGRWTPPSQHHRGDGHRGDGYRGDGYRGDGHRGEGYRGEGYRGDGHRGDAHPGDGRGDGYRGDRERRDGRVTLPPDANNRGRPRGDERGVAAPGAAAPVRGPGPGANRVEPGPRSLPPAAAPGDLRPPRETRPMLSDQDTNRP